MRRNARSRYDFGLKVPLRLSKKYGASVYATVRQYVSKNHHACAVVVLDPPEVDTTFGFRANMHRVLYSQSFFQVIGEIDWPEFYTPQDLFWNLIPLEKKRMSMPRPIWLMARDGSQHRCIAEGFKTKFYTIILMQAREGLNSRIIIPEKTAWSQAQGSRYILESDDQGSEARG